MKISRGGAIRVALFAAAACATASSVGAGRARAADDLVPAIEDVGGGAPADAQRWMIAAGGRASLLRGAGYDPFSVNDVLGQFSVTALRAFPTGRRLSTAVGALWESGSTSADARGGSADLSLWRVGVVLEERFAPRPWAYAFGRVAPSWLRGRAQPVDAASPALLTTAFSGFGADASVGVAGNLNARSRGLGVWLLADGGYGWAATQHLDLSPALAAADKPKAGVTSLGDLAPRGAFFRFCLALGW